MYLGIDCGTQGTKVVLLDPETGSLVARGHASHPIIFEANGRREQKAEWWIDALRRALKELFAQTTRSPADVWAVGVSGQQHGLVMLDGNGAVVRNVKLWNDTETTAVNEKLFNEAGGEKRIRSLIGTTIPVGFTASKVAWVRLHEPETYERVEHVLLPHDYVNFWLTGEYATDAGEASGTGYFDVLSRTWSMPMANLIDPTGRLERSLPRIASPLEPIGTIRPEVAAEFGFSPGTLVSCGSGDNVMGALGVELLKRLSSSLTSVEGVSTAEHRNELREFRRKVGLSLNVLKELGGCTDQASVGANMPPISHTGSKAPSRRVQLDPDPFDSMGIAVPTTEDEVRAVCGDILPRLQSILGVRVPLSLWLASKY